MISKYTAGRHTSFHSAVGLSKSQSVREAAVNLIRNFCFIVLSTAMAVTSRHV